jgi:hypothetical protein
MYQPNPLAIYPFLQYLYGGGGVGGGANPFFNIYSPAPPGNSQMNTWPTPPAGPGAMPPAMMPPPRPATTIPPQMTGGATPIGQVPPAPFGTVAAGQGGQGIPGAAGAATAPPAINPAAVPPFTATMPAPPALLGQQAQAPSGGGGAPTWVFRNGQYVNQATGQVGQPGNNDMVYLFGGGPGPNGSPIPYSQFIAQGYAGQPGGAAGPFTQTFGGGGGGDRGAPQMGGTQPGGPVERGGRVGPGGDLSPGQF